MPNFLPYCYSALWFICCLFFIYFGTKIHKILWYAGGICLFMGAWQLADIFNSDNLFQGNYGMAYRFILAGLLLVGLIWYWFVRDSLREKYEKKEK